MGSLPKSSGFISSRYLILYVISGFGVMAMETIWIRRLSLVIGNTVTAATSVICVFFVFAAFGNLFGGWLVKRLKNTALWYGLTEIGFVVSALLLYRFASYLQPVDSISEITVLFNNSANAILLVALPSFFAGISLPLLMQAFVLRTDIRTKTGGLFYAGNLLGASAGVLGGGILLPMYLGYQTSVNVISLLGVLQGLLAIVWKNDISGIPEQPEIAPKNLTGKNSTQEISTIAGYLILTLSGVLGIGLELLILQYFRQFDIGSIYLVTAVLFAFIIGMSAGSLCASLVHKTKFNTRQLLTFFLWASGIMCVLYTVFFHSILDNAVKQGGYLGGQDMPLTKFAIWTILKTTFVLLPLLICTGTIFPLAWEITDRSSKYQGSFFGTAVFVNKIGCALGAVLLPFLIVPWLGLTISLIAIGMSFIMMVLFLDFKFRSELKPLGILLRIIGALLIAVIFIVRKSDVILAKGDRLFAVYNGAGTCTTIIEDDKQSRHIVLNQQYILNGTQSALSSQQNESWIPLVLTPEAKRVAFIGVASGISAAAALDFPIQKLEAIEIIPDVKKAAQTWFSEWNTPLFQDKRSAVIVNDGRRVITASHDPYDVVICDLILPAGEATNDLYSKDFMEMVKHKLNAKGVFCLWLPLYQMDEELAGIVIKTFAEVYPYAIAVRSNFDPQQNTLGLIGSAEPIDISSQTLQKRLDLFSDSSKVRKSVFLRSVANFRLAFVGDIKESASYFSAYPVTTDNNPVFAFKGPKPLQKGSVLRAITYLKWSGKYFPATNYPSCYLGSTEASDIQSGLRAGNNYYAAAVNSVYIPVSPERQSQRYLQALQYLKIAKDLSPLSEVDFDK